MDKLEEAIQAGKLSLLSHDAIYSRATGGCRFLPRGMSGQISYEHMKELTEAAQQTQSLRKMLEVAREGLQWYAHSFDVGSEWMTTMICDYHKKAKETLTAIEEMEKS